MNFSLRISLTPLDYLVTFLSLFSLSLQSKLLLFISPSLFPKFYRILSNAFLFFLSSMSSALSTFLTISKYYSIPLTCADPYTHSLSSTGHLKCHLFWDPFLELLKLCFLLFSDEEASLYAYFTLMVTFLLMP